ncbi:MAG TPA: gliding motility-associated C-terminal domain-containing protein [Sphingobacteriaceae bacterium]
MKTGLLCLLICCLAFTGYSQTRVWKITEGNSVILHAQGEKSVKFQWFKNGDIISGADKKNITVNSAGVYTVMVFNEESCSSDQSDGVQIIIEPRQSIADLAVTKKSEEKPTSVNESFEYRIVAFNKGPGDATDITVTDSLPVGLLMEDWPQPMLGVATYNTNSRILSWTITQLKNGETAELNIKVRANTIGFVKNTASITGKESDPNHSNNRSSDWKEVKLMKIPNVFTPNGDGRNDQFAIMGLEQLPENELEIINRWGDRVYQAKAYKSNWTGEGLNEGTYFYVLKVKTSTGIWQLYKGYITLLRKEARELSFN